MQSPVSDYVIMYTSHSEEVNNRQGNPLKDFLASNMRLPRPLGSQ